MQTEDWGTYLDDNQTGKFPMYMLGWSADFADPDNFIYTFFGGQEAELNFGYQNQEVTDLLVQARQEPDEAARAELYGQASQIIYDQVPAIPVAHNPVLNAVRVGVEGFEPSPLGSTVPFRTITVTE